MQVSASERSTEIDYLYKKIEETYQDLAEHVKESETFKKEKIKALEGYYRKLIHINELKRPLSDIAQLIIKGCEEHKIPAQQIDASWVYDNVSEDCHDNYEPQIRTQLKGVNIGSDSVNQLLNYNNSPVSELSPEEIQEEVEKLKPHLDQLNEAKRREQERLNELIERASKEKIALTIPVKSQQITTPMPNALETVIYADKLEELGYALIDYSHEVRKFTTSATDDKKYAKSVQPYIDEINFLKDKKYTKGQRGWLQTIKTKTIGFKHEAGSIHKSLGKFKIKKYDDEGNEYEEWVELPREMTREQVGDRADILIDYALNKINAEFLCEAMEEFHDKYMEPYIAGRKLNLHDILSDKA